MSIRGPCRSGPPHQLRGREPQLPHQGLDLGDISTGVAEIARRGAKLRQAGRPFSNIPINRQGLKITQLWQRRSSMSKRKLLLANNPLLSGPALGERDRAGIPYREIALNATD